MAYRKTPASEQSLKNLKENAANDPKIRCPLCHWSPNDSSRWMCADADAPEYFYNACYSTWNTFETRGLCPTCGHQWIWTSCLSCYQWSRHEDWYAKKD